jgi:thioredoxin 2
MIRRCAACGKSNRVPAKHLADTGKCGACKAALPPVAEPISADTATFDEIVNNATVPVLVDFWAAWCGPCRMAAPEVARTAEAVKGRGLVLKVDTEAQPDLAARYRVSGIPYFVVFRGGKPVFQQAGLVKAPTMVGWVDSAAAGRGAA